MSEGSVSDLMSVMKSDASKVEQKSDEEQPTTKSESKKADPNDKPVIDQTQKELESFVKKPVAKPKEKSSNA